MSHTKHNSSTPADHRHLVALPRLIIRKQLRASAPVNLPQLKFGIAAAVRPQATGPAIPVALLRAGRAVDFSSSAKPDSARPNVVSAEPMSAAQPKSGQVGKVGKVGKMLRALSLLSTMMVGACANFSQPMTDMELRAESESCARSSLCRLLIEDRPPVLTLAVNDAALCEINAQRAERILEQKGIETRRYMVRLKPIRSGDFHSTGAQTQLMHTFVGARIGEKWFAVDNGSLPYCENKVCKLSEALHNVELISSNSDYHVAMVAAAAAATVASNP